MRLHSDDGYNSLSCEEAQTVNPHPSGYSIGVIQLEEGFEGCISRWEGPERFLTWHRVSNVSSNAHVREQYELGRGRGWEPSVGHEMPGIDCLHTFQYHTDEEFPPPAENMLFRGRRTADNATVWFRLTDSGFEYVWECDAVLDMGPGPLQILE
jgi:hypothetical protein